MKINHKLIFNIGVILGVFAQLLMPSLIRPAAAATFADVSQQPFGALDIARAAIVTVSSTQSGYSALAINDGDPGGYPAAPTHEWASNGEKAGAWVNLAWSSPQTIDVISLYDRPNNDDQVLGGKIEFSDGSSVLFGILDNDGSIPRNVEFPAKTITWAKITITEVSGATSNAGFSEIAAYDLTDLGAHTNSLRYMVTAVAANTFHVVAYPSGNPTPPLSPFVVKSTTYPNSIVKTTADGETTVATPVATVDMRSDGHIRVVQTGSRTPLISGTFDGTVDDVSFVLTHNADDRIYGAGNKAMNEAGDLTHPSGTSLVANGVTTIPFLWSSGGWSIFAANNESGISWTDSDGALSLYVPAPYSDFYITVAPTAYGLLGAYSKLTGTAPIPPKWTFGFMLSRWGYNGVADVEDKWHQFRDRNIPIDAFIYDYDWFNNDWDFNPNTISAAGIQKMHSMGLHFVGIIKPRVNGDHLAFARNQGWLLNAPFGADLHFEIPAARYWWWAHHAPLVEDGVDGWWNDEAEQKFDEFFQITSTEWTGWRSISSHRSWSISRAFAPGMQRFGTAAWTGDINSTWTTLQNQPGTLLNWSLAGMPYVGQDIGGFQSTPTPELYSRWIEEGVYVPVMRAHGTFDSPRWPWAFGDDALAAIKKSIELRYRLIPYIYTFAAQTASTGAPLIRPLFLEFPKDPQTYNLEDEWLLGSRLLAAPVLDEGGSRDVYLPTGTWYDFNTNQPVQGGQTLHIQVPLDTIPAYVRAGSIITLGPIIQSTALGQEDPLEVRIYPGENASFTLYEDDGDTYAYQSGQSSRIPFTWINATKTLIVGQRTGSFKGMLTARHLQISVAGSPITAVTYSGKPIMISLK